MQDEPQVVVQLAVDPEVEWARQPVELVTDWRPEVQKKVLQSSRPAMVMVSGHVGPGEVARWRAVQARPVVWCLA